MKIPMILIMITVSSLAGNGYAAETSSQGRYGGGSVSEKLDNNKVLDTTSSSNPYVSSYNSTTRQASEPTINTNDKNFSAQFYKLQKTKPKPVMHSEKERMKKKRKERKRKKIELEATKVKVNTSYRDRDYKMNSGGSYNQSSFVGKYQSDSDLDRRNREALKKISVIAEMRDNVMQADTELVFEDMGDIKSVQRKSINNTNNTEVDLQIKTKKAKAYTDTRTDAEIKEARDAAKAKVLKYVEEMEEDNLFLV